MIYPNEVIKSIIHSITVIQSIILLGGISTNVNNSMPNQSL